MEIDNRVRIKVGGSSRKEKIALVKNLEGKGTNKNKVQVYIEGAGYFWYFPEDLEVIEEAGIEVVAAEIVEESDHSKTLEQLEARIAQGLKGYYQAGLALIKIQNEALYEELGYRSFEQYFRERWGMERTAAFRFIKAAIATRHLIEVKNNNVANWQHQTSEEKPLWIESDILPENESQIRSLTGYDPEIQPVIWERAVEEAQGKPTAKIVKKVAKEVAKEVESKQTEIDLDRIEKENLAEARTSISLELLSVGDICVIQAGEESELRRYQGFWGVVTEVGEFSCNVEVYDRTVEWVKPEYLVKLEISQEEKERAVALMGRLRTIAEKEPVERMISAILLELAKRRDFKLAEREEQILALIERLVGIAID